MNDLKRPNKISPKLYYNTITYFLKASCMTDILTRNVDSLAACEVLAHIVIGSSTLQKWFWCSDF